MIVRAVVEVDVPAQTITQALTYVNECADRGEHLTGRVVTVDELIPQVAVDEDAE